MNILHVAHYDKFLPKHITFTNEHFAQDNHFFLMMDKEKKVKRVVAPNVKYIGYKALFFNLFRFYQADRIILHGLFEKRLLHILFLNPWLIKKCYWTIWGGDLYNYVANQNDKKKRSLEFFRRFVIKRIPHFVTYVPGDYEKAVEWYGAKGEIHECFLYHSNIFTPRDLPAKQEKSVNILVGNSASLSNNHLEVFEQLKRYKNENIKIYSPLSYGKVSQRKMVIERGREIFGEKFVPIVDLMPLDEYLAFLSEIDIAIFNHKRQQAMGNIINLLGLGKKVYMREEVTSFQFLTDLGIKIFTNDELSLEGDFPQKEENQKIIASKFCENELLKQWGRVYN